MQATAKGWLMILLLSSKAAASRKIDRSAAQRGGGGGDDESHASSQWCVWRGGGRRHKINTCIFAYARESTRAAPTWRVRRSASATATAVPTCFAGRGASLARCPSELENAPPARAVVAGGPRPTRAAPADRWPGGGANADTTKRTPAAGSLPFNLWTGGFYLRLALA